ncbi:MAG: undecaprenyl-diphosphatase UppP [Melioribacteraceae bacterium]|nr:undecaprenyl-diphosphatase UppP [Melioribacteraceae bacterium]
MNTIEAIILGIIQGLTEFLPISSTGHLTLYGKITGLINPQFPEKWTSFIAVIQIGTLIAVLIYFWRDLISIANDFFKENLFEQKAVKSQSLNSKMGWYLIIATIPVAVIGLLFKDFIEGVFTKNLMVIALSLIILALILAIAEKSGKFSRKINDIKWYDALIIGIAQAISLIPGSSRSGTTITAGLFLGLDRETAARFSFLMSIPAVAASGLLQFYESLSYINLDGLIAMIIATFVSALVGYLSIEYLLKYLRKKTTFIFVYYRVAVGIIVLIMLYLNIIYL